MDISSIVNKYNNTNTEIKQLQDTKKKLERVILKYLYNKPNKTIMINDKRYTAKEITNKEGFSQKFIENKLTLIIKNKEQVAKIMEFLKNNRKESTNIKLYTK